MGNALVSRKPLDPLIGQFKQYMFQQIPVDHLSIADDVQLEVRRSTLSTTEFNESRDRGVFTKKGIPKKTVICDIKQLSFVMNDPLVDLRGVNMSKTSDSMYTALVNLKREYYSHENAAERINTCFACGQDGEVYVRTIKHVPANTELFRMYGFETWIFELFDIITDDNVNGFAQFVKELTQPQYDNPYTAKIQRLDTVLDSLLSLRDPSLSVGEQIVKLTSELQ